MSVRRYCLPVYSDSFGERREIIVKGIRLANIVCRGPGPIDIADLSKFVGTTLKTQLSTVVATQKPPEIMTQEQGTCCLAIQF
jgi:hypothetical protein